MKNITNIYSDGSLWGLNKLEKLYFNAINCADLNSYENFPFSEMGTSLETGTDVIFGEGVTRIPAYLFYNDYDMMYRPNINDITISSTVQSIGNNAFGLDMCINRINFNAVNCADLDENSTVFDERASDMQVTFGEGVKHIPAYLFESINVTSVTMSSTIESIGAYAFSNCSSITQLIIPDSVETIGESAFYKCSGLQTLVIGAGVTNIGNNAFYNCTNLTKIDYYAANCADLSSNNGVFMNAGQGGAGIQLTFGEGVIKIPAYLFNPGAGTEYSFCKVTSMSMSSSVEVIGSHAFGLCNRLTTLQIGSGVKQIESRIAANCSHLSRIEFNAIECNNFTEVSQVFEGCGLESDSLVVVIGEGVKKIPDYLFYQTDITELIIGSTVESIGIYAFANCYSLESVTIPDNVEEIEAYAFMGCTLLKTVEIGQGVADIGDSSFGYCNYLEKVNFNAINCGDFTPMDSPFYDSGSNSEKLQLVFGNGVKRIPARMFECTNFSEISISSTVESIGYDAFADCDSLESVTIPDNVEIIESNAFSNCTSLSTLEIGESVKTIGDEAFSNCNINELIIPDSVETIGESAFENCSGLQTLVIGAGVKEIEIYAFNYCSRLTKVDYKCIDAKCYSGNDSYFIDAGKLSGGFELIFHNGVINIPQYIFDSSYVTSISMSATVKEIGEYAFSYCHNLYMLEIGEGVEYIDNNAFYNTGLTRVDIPASVLKLGSGAFYNPNEEGIIINMLGSVEGGTKSMYTELGSSTVFNKAIVYVAPEDLNGYKAQDYYLNTNCVASLRARGFKVTFDYNISGMENTQIEWIVGEVELPNVTRDGYEFLGWYLSENLLDNEKIDENTEITTETTVYAKYKYIGNWSDAYTYTTQGSDVYISGFDADKLSGVVDFVIPRYDNSGQVIKGINSSVFSANKLHTLSFKSGSELTEIKENAFINCSNLISVDFANADNLNTIGANAFKGCNITGEMILPSELSLFNYTTFDNNKITTFEINNDTYKSSDGIVYSADYTEIITVPDVLPSSIILPSTITTIDSYVFEGVQGLLAIEGAEVISVEEYAFANSSLQYFKFPNLESIGNNAFDGAKLITVELAETVTTVGDKAFVNNQGLVSIVIEGKLGETRESAPIITSVLANNESQIKVYISDEDIEAYNLTNWSRFNLVGIVLGKVYMVTIDLDGGQGYPDYMYVIGGKTIELESTPTKLGYEFVTWKKVVGEELVEFDFGEVISDNITIKAVWNKIVYTITYSINGGEIDGEISYIQTFGIEDFGAEFDQDILIKTPERLGYHFIGWYTKSDFDSAKVQSIKYSNLTYNQILGQEEIHLYAKWEIYTFTMHFDNSSNYSIALDNDIVNPVPYGSDFGFVIILADNYSQNTVENIVVNIYTADKQTLVTTLSNISTQTTDLHYLLENITNEYYIEVTGLVINTYKVYFISSINGASDMPTALTINWGETVDKSLLSTPTITGYSFANWHRRTLVDDGEVIDANPFNFNSPIKSEITLIAKYVALEYDITLILNGATLNGRITDSFNIKYSIEDTVVLPINNELYNIVKLGYNITGWYSDYEENDGVYTINRDSLTNIISSGTTGNLSFVLDFDIIEYHIDYHFNGGVYTENYITTFTVNDTLELIRPTKAGYVFNGWYLDDRLLNRKISAIEEGTTGDISLYANYVENNFNITYNLNGSAFSPVFIGGVTVDSSINTYTYIYTFNNKEDFELDTTVSRKGYQFAGWYDNAECSGNSIQTIGAGEIVTDKQFYAKWTPIEYTITFDYTDLYIPTESDTTELILTIDDLENAEGSIDITMTPAVTGYNFLGWEYNGQQYTEITLDNIDNITIVANFEKKKYNITLLGQNVEGNIALFNNDVSITTVNYADDLVFQIKVTNPKYTQALDDLVVSYSYSIDGEFTIIESSAGTFIIPNVQGALYIKIDNVVINKFTIQFVVEGGDKISPITNVYYGQSIPAPTAPTRDGYTFTNWYTSDEFTQIFNFETPITSDLTLYAGWEMVDFTATIYNNVNDTTKSLTFNIDNAGSVSLNSNNFNIRGYEFKGFYLMDTQNPEDYMFNDDNLIENLVGIYANAKIIARFEIANYSIYYGIDAGINGAGNPSTYTVDSEEIVLTPASKTNYVFVAWVNVETNEVVTSIDPANTIGDIYLVATFELAGNEFVTIRYYAMGEFYSEVAVRIGESIKNTESAQVTPKVIPGYNFIGYYADEQCTHVFDMSSNIDRNINLYGKYEKVTYTITYLSNAGEFVNPIENKTVINIDDDFNLVDPYKKGYLFEGWYVNVSVDGGSYDFTNAERFTRITKQNGDLTLYAKFSIITYTITYNLNDSILDNLVESYTVETDTFTIGIPTKIGYTFTGWTGFAEKNLIVSKGTIGNINLVANFDIITYSVTYSDSKTSTNNVTTYTINSSPSLLQHNDVLGYSFLGWFDNYNTRVEVVGGGQIGDIELTARYEIIEYTITYLLNGGVMQMQNPDKYTVETEIEQFYIPSKLGFTFIKWSDVVTGKDVTGISKGTTGDITLTANYNEVDNFAVIIYYIDGNKYLFDSVEMGATINSITPPEKDYYEFEGWYSDKALTNKITSNTIITSDLSLYSKFLPINYTISYQFVDSKGNVLTNVINVNDLEFNIEKLIQFSIPAAQGYTFKQFKYNNNVISNTFGIYENITIVGEFELATFTIDYILNGGKAHNITSYTVEDDAYTLNDARREGFKFLGWFDNETGEKITVIDPSNAKNYTLVAKWNDPTISNKKDDSGFILILILSLFVVTTISVFIIAILRRKLYVRRMMKEEVDFNIPETSNKLDNTSSSNAGIFIKPKEIEVVKDYKEELDKYFDSGNDNKSDEDQNNNHLDNNNT